MSELDYHAEVRHDGHLCSFEIANLELPNCQACGELIFTEITDQQVNDALRAYLNLLTPAQIEAGLRRIGMSDSEAARRLGVDESTLTRWVDGLQIQTRAMDNLLRVFLAFPQLRSVLCGENQDPSLGMADIIATSDSR